MFGFLYLLLLKPCHRYPPHHVILIVKTMSLQIEANKNLGQNDSDSGSDSDLPKKSIFVLLLIKIICNQKILTQTK
jgi:hypothetical protein